MVRNLWEPFNDTIFQAKLENGRRKSTQKQKKLV